MAPINTPTWRIASAEYASTRRVRIWRLSEEHLIEILCQALKLKRHETNLEFEYSQGIVNELVLTEDVTTQQ